jgi:two-component system, OmpR family, response regulator
VEVTLTPKEFSILEYLLRRMGQVVSRMSVLEHVWDPGYDGESNVVDVYMAYLRKKIDAPFGRRAIETVRGVGYRLRPDGG